jgi:hypothetical protein
MRLTGYDKQPYLHLIQFTVMMDDSEARRGIFY